mmetsp:Transcript_7588/g.11167  ORF Transcript_7588/g.11167 Transcript_7588/m.11167 type:complete len:128 (-) Transcript_7588:28-411(-)
MLRLPAVLYVIYIFSRMASSCKEASAVYITIDSSQKAEELAKGLVDSELAACVNIIPSVKSVYKWENQVHVDEELLLMVKTRSELIPSLTEWVQNNHPYDCPEVISVPITSGNPAYLQFVTDSTKNP